jgi:hypothetical protein
VHLVGFIIKKFVCEFVSYKFNIILNICSLNACLTKASILLTRTWRFQQVQLKKSVCLRNRFYPPVLQLEKRCLVVLPNLDGDLDFMRCDTMSTAKDIYHYVDIAELY